MKEEPKPENPLCKYRVVIEQMMFHAIEVEAENADAAEELAYGLFLSATRDGEAGLKDWQSGCRDFEVHCCDPLSAEEPAASPSSPEALR